MSNVTGIEQKKINLIRQEVSNNFYSRLLAEMLCAFILIFTINFGITMGEIGLPFFVYIYNVNIIIALWIGTFTFLSFLWTRNTTISSNFMNLVINYKNDNINRLEFWMSGLFQFIGGMFAAIMVFFIGYVLAEHNLDVKYVMGGTTPKVKGIFFSNPGIFGYDYLISSTPQWNENILTHKYGFAALQGLINAFAIIISFTLNTLVDRKYNNGSKALALRYIILIVVISTTTIAYANTTNWVRLLTPAIVGSISGINKELLTTTLTFISTQILGLLVVYYLLFVEKEG